MAKQELRMVAIGDVIPSPDNPRVINKKSASFQELIESIKSVGVMQRLDVRPHPDRDGKFDLRAGERRLAAAKEAGLDTVPVIVHIGMSEEEAFELTFTENFGREDLTVLEQSKAVGTLLEKYSGDLDAVASKMGQTQRWVRMRQSIHTDLIVDWKEHDGWTAAHLELIARLPAEMQRELCQEFCTSWRYREGHRPSVKEFQDDISKHLNLLRRAPWDLGSVMVGVKAPACTDCNNRSGCQPDLWEDDLDEKTVKKNDRCLNKRCWEEKSIAFLKGRSQELQKEHPGLKLISSTSYVSHSEGQPIRENIGSFMDSDDYDSSKKDAKDAIPALVVHGKGVGNLRWIKPKSYAGRTGGGKESKVKGVPKPLKVRKEMLKSKRWCEVLRRMIERLDDTDFEQLTPDDKTLAIVSLAGRFGTHEKHAYCYARNINKWKGMWDVQDLHNGTGSRTIVDAKMEMQNLWEQVQLNLSSRLNYIGPITQLDDCYITEARHVAKLIGADIEAIFIDVSQEKKFLEPKAWSKLNEDGTPKKADKTKKTKRKKKG